MKIPLIALIIFVSCSSTIPSAKAESEAACAIWLCLPGGFPTGCASAYSEFKHRIKKGKSPLPNLSSCTTGPDGQSSNGRYSLGVEYFMPCKAGFAIDENLLRSSGRGVCKPTNPACARNNRYSSSVDCASYSAVRRSNPSYVEMWVDGQYLGKFFY